MTDPKNTQSAQSASPSGKQDIVKPVPPKKDDSTNSPGQDIVKPK